VKGRATEIQTVRLCLRAISDCDRDNLIALLTNHEIKKTFMVPELKTTSEQMQMFDVLKAMSHSPEHFVRGIYLHDDLIGFLNDVEIDGKEIEIGYVIHPSKKNQGYMTEALNVAIPAMFDAGYSVVRAGAFEENTASIRVMEKSAMQLIEKTEEIEYRGQTHHCIFYAIRRK
jgi:RimJ/RimL family protein N-acetyltransferase